MNKRIRELAQKAYFHGDDIWLHSDRLERFAQSIVQECAKIANRQFETATGLDDRDCLTANEMKQYFGVQE